MGSKLSIVFAFFLSIAIAAGAFYLYQIMTEERGFRREIEKKYDDKSAEVMALTSEKEQIRAAKEQLQSEYTEVQHKFQNTEAKLNELQTVTSNASAERSELEKQLKEKEARLEEMERKVTELQKQAEEAMRACKITPADVKTSLSSSGGGLTFESPETAVLSVATESVASMPSRVVTAPAPAQVVTPVPAPSAPVTPVVSAPAPTGPRILTVNRKFNFVVVNMGLKDGIKMGDQLKVVRAGVDSATIQVEKLYDKFSAATILNESPSIQVTEGDEVRRS